MIKAILFDLDGTLVNSLADLADCCNFALEKFGFPTHTTDKYNYFVGDGMKKLVERIIPEGCLGTENEQKVYDCFLDRYKTEYCNKTLPYEGVNELLRALHLRGYKLAIISNKNELMAKAVAEKLLPNCFSAVFGKREDFPPKPDAALTLKLIEELGLSPQNCILIGDSGMDMKTAVNSGLLCIGALWGFREKDELISSGADYLANKPLDILELLRKIENKQ